jgi:hypothetical protein
LFGAGVNVKADLAPVNFAATWVKILRFLRDQKDELTGTIIPWCSNELWDVFRTIDNSFSSGIENFVDGHRRQGMEFKNAYERTQLMSLSPKDGLLAVKIEDVAEKRLRRSATRFF